MRAVSQQTFGGPEVLEVVDVDPPTPIPTEVLVRVKAIGVNPVEAIVRAGAFPLLGEPPFILGWDLSGVVEDVVPGTTRFAPGDEVYGMPFFPRATPTPSWWPRRRASSRSSRDRSTTPTRRRCRSSGSPRGRASSTSPPSDPGTACSSTPPPAASATSPCRSPRRAERT